MTDQLAGFWAQFRQRFTSCFTSLFSLGTASSSSWNSSSVYFSIGCTTGRRLLYAPRTSSMSNSPSFPPQVPKGILILILSILTKPASATLTSISLTTPSLNPRVSKCFCTGVYVVSDLIRHILGLPRCYLTCIPILGSSSTFVYLCTVHLHIKS